MTKLLGFKKQRNQISAQVFFTILFSAFFTFLLADFASAHPVRGKVMRFLQPDGTPVEVRVWGDEFYRVMESLDGYTLVRNPTNGEIQYAVLSPDQTELIATGVRVGTGDPAKLAPAKHLRISKEASLAKIRTAKANLRRAPRPQGDILRAPPAAQTTGTRKGLVVIVDFSDRAGTILRAAVDDFCNQTTGYSAYGNNGSVYNYFYDMSNGRLNYTCVIPEYAGASGAGDFTPAYYYRAKKTKSYYENSNNPFGETGRELALEALEALRTKGFDFSQVDGNGDKIIDGVNIFYAGSISSVDSGLWPHSWTVDFTANGCSTDKYQITNMSDDDDDGDDGLYLATFCHENGHMLCDFPDLYDYDFDSSGVGVFCLMAAGIYYTEDNPTAVCAYLRYKAGWLTVNDITAKAGETITLTAASTDAALYRNLGNVKEYFLAEVRHKSGRDVGLPASGLAVWHVDENGSNDYNQRTAAFHYECTLVQADARWDLENNANEGDATDLFSAAYNATLNDATSPNANWWNGSVSGLHLSQISTAGTTMTFQIPNQPGSLKLSAATYSVAENVSGGRLYIPVKRVGGSSGAVGCGYAVIPGSAAENVDYKPTSGTLSWANGDSADKTIALEILDDTLLEGDETLTLALNSPTGGTTLASPSSAVITIVDDDLAPCGTIGFGSFPSSTNENSGQVAVVVKRSEGTRNAVSVSYATGDGTAVAGSDYVAVAGTLSWADGESGDKTFLVEIVNDAIIEDAESFYVTLSNPTGGASLSSTPTIEIVIVDDDALPNITGALTAVAEKGKLFSYTIVATGTAPLSFSASGLPSGLTLSGDTIAGTVSAAGTYALALTASNSAGSDAKTLILTVANTTSGANIAPRFTSKPSAGPNPATVGEIVAFNVAVEDPDGDALNVAWDFGDGNTSTALTPTHAYAASGIYNAAVSVSDGAASVSASILVAVSADAESVGSNDELKVQKFMLKLSFSKTGKDSMALSGTVPVEIDSPTDGRFFILAVGDLFYDLDLDAKGKAKIGNVSIKVAGKVKADRYLASPLKFSFSVKNAALRDDLADLGFIDKNTSSAGETVNFSIAVIFDEVVYLNELSAVYKAKARKTGSAKR